MVLVEVSFSLVVWLVHRKYKQFLEDMRFHMLACCLRVDSISN